MRGSGGQASGIAFEGRCGRWRAAGAVRAHEEARRTKLEGGAGGRRAQFACMKRRGGQVSDIAFNV
jgi:hypothetical protein